MNPYFLNFELDGYILCDFLLIRGCNYIHILEAVNMMHTHMLLFYNSFCTNLSHLLVVFLNGDNRCQTRKPVVLGYLSIPRVFLISQCLRLNSLTINMMKAGMQETRALLVVPGMATRPLLVVPGMATRHLVAKPSDSVRKGVQTNSAPSGKNLW